MNTQGLTGRKLLVIVNPTSGHRMGQAIWQKVEVLLKIGDVPVQLVMTKYGGHARDLVMGSRERNVQPLECGKCSGVLVIGGDGTVCEVLNALVEILKRQLSVISYRKNTRELTFRISHRWRGLTVRQRCSSLLLALSLLAGVFTYTDASRGVLARLPTRHFPLTRGFRHRTRCFGIASRAKSPRAVSETPLGGGKRLVGRRAKTHRAVSETPLAWGQCPATLRDARGENAKTPRDAQGENAL